jgi:hypothetical protein
MLKLNRSGAPLMGPAERWGNMPKTPILSQRILHGQPALLRGFRIKLIMNVRREVQI